MLTPLVVLVSLAASPHWKHAKAVSEAVDAARWQDGPAVDAPTVVKALEGAIPECVASAAGCVAYGFDGRATAERKRIVSTLVEFLGEVGGPEHLPLLLKLGAGGVVDGDIAAEKITTRAWQARMAIPPKDACGPPTPEKIAEAARALEGFVVLDAAAEGLSAREPTAEERADLSYLLASISPADTPIGEGGDQSSWLDAPKGDDPEASHLWKAWKAAQATGDDEQLIAASRALLNHHGYPGTLTAKSAQFTWGGATFSTVLRELAPALERRGAFVEAAQLYRRADPGGGACGTSFEANWTAQLKGLIRTAESAGRCGDVIAERLTALKPPFDASILSARGFDLRRLYRGAQVARNRGDRPLVEQALAQLPEPRRERAQRRLAEKGLEHWDQRVHARVGLIGLLRPEELVQAARELGRIDPTAGNLVEALDALADRARHSNHDPCRPIPRNGRLTVSFSMGSTSVSALNGACETRLTAAEEDELAAAIVALPRSAWVWVSSAKIKALGAVASPVGAAQLEQGATAFGVEPRQVSVVARELADALALVKQARRHGPRVRQPE